MKRREFLSGVGSAALLAQWAEGGNVSQLATGRSPPNIIFLMTDQQRWDALGVLNSRIKTPNLDRLAKAGVVLSPSHVPGAHVRPEPQFDDVRVVPPRNSASDRTHRHALGDSFLPFDPLPAQLRASRVPEPPASGKHIGGRTDEIPSTRGFDVRVPGRNPSDRNRGALSGHRGPQGSRRLPPRDRRLRDGGRGRARLHRLHIQHTRIATTPMAGWRNSA